MNAQAKTYASKPLSKWFARHCEQLSPKSLTLFCSVALVPVILAVTATTTRAQATYTPYAFTNFAGLPGGPGSADGTGSAAQFNGPEGVAVDSAGNVYVADSENFTIRKVTPAGAVTTLAGSARQSGTNDGTGGAARFGQLYDGYGGFGPQGVAVDGAGNVYVADTWNQTIRKITPAGETTTLAGSARQSGTNDGTGSVARFGFPTGVAVDSAGNVYVAETWNLTIRKITPAGEVTTLAGSAGRSGTNDGTGSAARFNYPNGVAVDSVGNVYVTDSGNDTIRKITPAGAVTTLAGSARQSGTNDGTGSAARFNSPDGVAVDSAGNVYVADSDNLTIRKITPTGAVTTLAGSAGQFGSEDGIGSAARFGGLFEGYGFSYGPQSVSVDNAGNVYVADSPNHTIRKITPAGAVTTLAGSVVHAGSADGTGSEARLNRPHDVAVDGAGNVYVADIGNATIRKISPAGAVTTLAGSAGQYGNADGLGSVARFNSPAGVAADSAGNVYVGDLWNHTIRKITPVGAVTTLAGKAGHSGKADGTGSAARFHNPGGVAVDRAGNVYVADVSNQTIRKITPAGKVTTLAGNASIKARVNSGYFGGKTTVTVGGYADGTGRAARFHNPGGVAVDRAGNVYVADVSNQTIRKITPAGVVTTLAGSAGQIGSADGIGGAARFHNPGRVAVDGAGNVYVADTYNQMIRKITPAGVVTTLASSVVQSGSTDGAGSTAGFNFPGGVAVDNAGNLYVADSSNNRITKGTPSGLQFSTTAGSLTVSNGFFRMRLTGPSGSSVVVEASPNLQAWTPVQTNALPPGGLDLSVPLGTYPNQFFRARLEP